MIYLDNAATTYPKPPGVQAAVASALKDYCANPGRGGHTPSMRTAQAVYRARESIAEFFKLCVPENVVFTNNCTTALNTVIKGVLRRGDHVIISSLEHNSVLRPLDSLRQKGVITYSTANVGKNDDETIDAFRNALTDHTRLIVCTHASNVFGAVLPVRRLCALAHSYGVLFCLDAAQSAGVLDISMDDGYDFVCCAGHKSLYGPMGTGILLTGEGRELEPLTEGGTGSSSAEAAMPDYLPDRLESGTLNVPGVIGLSAGVRFLRDKGIKNIYKKEIGDISYLYDALYEMKKIKMYVPHPSDIPCAPVLSFTVDGADSETVAAYLNKEHGIAVRAGLHCAPLAHRHMCTEKGGTVRIAPSMFTSRRELQIFVNAVNKFVHLT